MATYIPPYTWSRRNISSSVYEQRLSGNLHTGKRQKILFFLSGGPASVHKSRIGPMFAGRDVYPPTTLRAIIDSTYTVYIGQN